MRTTSNAENRWGLTLLRVCFATATLAALVGLWLLGTRGSEPLPPELRLDTKPRESVVTKAVPSPRPNPAAPITAHSPTGDTKLEGLGNIPLKPWTQNKEDPPQKKPLAIGGGAEEKLPWDLVEPVPLTPLDSVEPSPKTPAAISSPQPRADSLPLQMPSDLAVKSWVRATATEIKGLAETRPMHHFEFWIAAPKEIAAQLAAVDYNFNTPAILPLAQSSAESTTGFRVRAGGLTCSENVTVTLRFRNAQTKVVTVDSCKLLTTAKQ